MRCVVRRGVVGSGEQPHAGGVRERFGWKANATALAALVPGFEEGCYVVAIHGARGVEVGGWGGGVPGCEEVDDVVAVDGGVGVEVGDAVDAGQDDGVGVVGELQGEGEAAAGGECRVAGVAGFLLEDDATDGFGGALWRGEGGAGADDGDEGAVARGGEEDAVVGGGDGRAAELGEEGEAAGGVDGGRSRYRACIS